MMTVTRRPVVTPTSCIQYRYYLTDEYLLYVLSYGVMSEAIEHLKSFIDKKLYIEPNKANNYKKRKQMEVFEIEETPY